MHELFPVLFMFALAFVACASVGLIIWNSQRDVWKDLKVLVGSATIKGHSRVGE